MQYPEENCRPWRTEPDHGSESSRIQAASAVDRFTGFTFIEIQGISPLFLMNGDWRLEA
jgi:hypothetical protein